MKQKSANNYRQRSFVEKVSFTISLSIVSLIVILICYTWVTGDNHPPILSIKMTTEIREVNQQYYVPFTVINYGGLTAEAVEVVAQLSLDNGETENGMQLIDFLSRKEQRKGEFIFTKNPQEGKLTMRVASYKLP